MATILSNERHSGSTGTVSHVSVACITFEKHEKKDTAKKTFNSIMKEVPMDWFL